MVSSFWFRKPKISTNHFYCFGFYFQNPERMIDSGGSEFFPAKREICTFLLKNPKTVNLLLATSYPSELPNSRKWSVIRDPSTWRSVGHGPTVHPDPYSTVRLLKKNCYIQRVMEIHNIHILVLKNNVFQPRNYKHGNSYSVAKVIRWQTCLAIIKVKRRELRIVNKK